LAVVNGLPHVVPHHGQPGHWHRVAAWYAGSLRLRRVNAQPSPRRLLLGLAWRLVVAAAWQAGQRWVPVVSMLKRVRQPRQIRSGMSCPQVRAVVAGWPLAGQRVAAPWRVGGAGLVKRFEVVSECGHVPGEGAGEADQVGRVGAVHAGLVVACEVPMTAPSSFSA